MGSTAADDRPDRIVARAAEGDPDAWRDLVETYSPRVYALLAQQCRDRDLAEEITQATFVKLVTQLGHSTDRAAPGGGGGGYEERGRFEPWLFRVAMNLLRDEMRRRGRQARPMSFGPMRTSADNPGEHGAAFEPIERRAADPFERASSTEQIEQMQQAIGQLPEADQQVLHLRHTAGLSFAEIAETLEQPLGTVLARGHRALGKLRRMMSIEPAGKSRRKPS